MHSNFCIRLNSNPYSNCAPKSLNPFSNRHDTAIKIFYRILGASWFDSKDCKESFKTNIVKMTTPAYYFLKLPFHNEENYWIFRPSRWTLLRLSIALPGDFANIFEFINYPTMSLVMRRRSEIFSYCMHYYCIERG